LKEIIVYCRYKWEQIFLRMKDTSIPKLVYGSTMTGRRKVGPSRKDEWANTLKTEQACNGLYHVAAVIIAVAAVYYYYYYY